ncbi:MAG: hypothetical protein WAN35_00975 [Terracidiphilus sp.]|jgi:hypothetical protein
MTENSRVELTQEYNTLRNELLEAKRYVFERPLAITALAAIGLQVLGKPQQVALPIAISFVTLFNLWFTVNRLQSASRIVAYIQLILEPSGSLPWIGWETSLRKYRTWLGSKGKREATKIVDKKLESDKTIVPDALMYYPAVYLFHVALMTFAVLTSIVLFKQDIVLFKQGTWSWTQALTLIPVGLGLWSLVYFWNSRPSRLRFSIERNLVIWNEAFASPAPPSQEQPTA